MFIYQIVDISQRHIIAVQAVQYLRRYFSSGKLMLFEVIYAVFVGNSHFRLGYVVEQHCKPYSRFGSAISDASAYMLPDCEAVMRIILPEADTLQYLRNKYANYFAVLKQYLRRVFFRIQAFSARKIFFPQIYSAKALFQQKPTLSYSFQAQSLKPKQSVLPEVFSARPL